MTTLLIVLIALIGLALVSYLASEWFDDRKFRSGMYNLYSNTSAALWLTMWAFGILVSLHIIGTLGYMSSKGDTQETIDSVERRVEAGIPVYREDVYQFNNHIVALQDMNSHPILGMYVRDEIEQYRPLSLERFPLKPLELQAAEAMED